MAHTNHSALVRTRYEPKCDKLDVLSEREIALLRKYGTWLEALAEGRIAPSSQAQRAFVSVCRGEAAPTTEFEKLWHTYQAQRIFECSQLAGWDFRDRAVICRTAACLGNEAALAWFEREKEALKAEEFWWEIPPLPKRQPLDVPRPRFLSDDVPRGSGASRTKPASSNVDWSDSFDDLDNSDWEGLLGGPDDSEFES